ncbi:MAG: ABC transporter substrate-binding protein [Chloroflexi bacterium]|nr:ABC transporter substrate-binding protein [Chloroflexota bacterium]
MRRFGLWILVALLVVGALLSGITSLAQDEKVLVIGHAESTDSLDPARGYTQTSGFIFRAIYETLVTFPDADASSIEPMLAESWEVSDDGLTYTFKLREGAEFASGNPVTADDVVFSFNRLKNLQGSPAFLADNIASVEATDPQTVVVTLASPDPSFLSTLPNPAFQVTDSQVIKENGGTDAVDAATADTAEEFLNNNSVGSGPYQLEKWEPQVETVLVRNPNYQGDAPYFDRVIITNIPESATQKIALEAGDIDLALDLTADEIGGLEGNPDIQIVRGPANIIHFLLMNADPDVGGPMADPKVQLAVRYALDYDGYAALWGGVQPGSNLAVGIAGALGPDEAIKRDVEKAKQLLAEAGYPDGFEVTLDYPDFSFQGVNMNTNAQKIQADLAEVGITVTLNPGELQVALEEYRSGKEGFGYWFWGPDKLDPVDFLSFLPGGKVATERALWTPERAEQSLLDLIEQAKVETDQAARLDLYRQLQQYAQQTSTFAPFNQPDIQTALRADIQGYVWHPQWLLDVALLSRSE